MKINKTAIFLIAFFLILGTVFVWYSMGQYKDQPKQLPVLGPPGHRVTEFAFTDQEGKTFTNKDVDGKVYIVEYFFTTCKGICPKMNENMSKVYEAYRGNDEVEILSHTVDPYKDTITAMKSYSLRFDADPEQWHFLTGDKKKLYDAARFNFLVTAVDDTSNVDIASDFIHTDRFILVDRDGYIRGSYRGTDTVEVNKLIEDIDVLLNEEEKPEAAAS